MITPDIAIVDVRGPSRFGVTPVQVESALCDEPTSCEECDKELRRREIFFWVDDNIPLCVKCLRGLMLYERRGDERD